MNSLGNKLPLEEDPQRLVPYVLDDTEASTWLPLVGNVWALWVQELQYETM